MWRAWLRRACLYNASSCTTQRARTSKHTHNNTHNHTQGKDAVAFLEGLVVGDIAGLADGTGSLSVFTNDKGGIIDDTVITKVTSRP